MKTLIVFCLLSISTARAQETIDYASGDVTGVVTLAEALDPNEANQIGDVSSYSFSANGLLNYTASQQLFAYDAEQHTFLFSTVNGQIDSFLFNIQKIAPAQSAGITVNFMASQSGSLLQETYYSLSEGAIPLPVVTTAGGSMAGAPNTVQAPEIDWSRAIPAVLFLCGMGLVINGRRSVRG